MNRVLVGAVLYNSNFERLIECMKHLSGQVEDVILYDNSENPIETEKLEFLTKTFKCRYISSISNLGMPGALNEIIKIAKKEGYTWVLTMNPDSIVPDNMMEVFSRYFNEKDIGIICPQVVDKRRKYIVSDTEKENEFVTMCISSAACTRVSAWEQIGGFDSWLFVDLLDNDLSKRMILNGWKILKVNTVILDQEFGEIQTKSENIVKFWILVAKLLNNKNFAKLSYKKTVSYTRVYYTCRNVLYLDKKFINYGGMDYEDNYNCQSFFGFLICFVLPNFLQAKSKRKVIKAIISGIKDGKKIQTEPWIANRSAF